MVRYDPGAETAEEEPDTLEQVRFIPSQKPNLQFSRERRHKTLANPHRPSGEHDFKTIPLSEEQQKIETRKQYVAVPERRHTSHRGRTFISKKPDLMSQLRMYYQPEDPDEEQAEAMKDNSFYTNQKLLERESLKFEPRVLNILEEIWKVTDRNHDGSVDREEYVRMSMKLYCAVVGDGDMENAKEVAEKEWVHDCFGYDDLDRNRFTQSWFQLADMWTEGLEVDEYVSFLSDVLVCLTATTEDGERRWRADDDIITIAEFQMKKEKEEKEIAPLIELARPADQDKEKKKKKKRSAAATSRLPTELPQWKRVEKVKSSGPGWGWGGNKSKVEEEGGVGFYGGGEEQKPGGWGRQVKLTTGAVNALRRTFKASKASQRIFQRLLEKVAREKDAELPEAKVQKREAEEIKAIVRTHAKRLHYLSSPVVVLEPEDALKRDQRLIHEAVKSISDKLLHQEKPEAGSPLKFATGADLVRAMSSIGCSFDPMEIVKVPTESYNREPGRPVLQSKTAVNVMGGGYSVRHQAGGFRGEGFCHSLSESAGGGFRGEGGHSQSVGLGAMMNAQSFNPAFHPIANPGDASSLYKRFGGDDFELAPQQYTGTKHVRSKQSYQLRAKKSPAASPHLKLHSNGASAKAQGLAIRQDGTPDKKQDRLKMMVGMPAFAEPGMAVTDGAHSWKEDSPHSSSPQSGMHQDYDSRGGHGSLDARGVMGEGYGGGYAGSAGSRYAGGASPTSFSNSHQLSLPVVPLFSASSSVAGSLVGDFGLEEDGQGRAGTDRVSYRSDHPAGGLRDCSSSVFNRSSHGQGSWTDEFEYARSPPKSSASRVDCNLVAEPLPSRNATEMLRTIRGEKMEIDQAAFGSKLKKGHGISTSRLAGAEKWHAGTQ
jgi:hypothetical protein